MDKTPIEVGQYKSQYIDVPAVQLESSLRKSLPSEWSIHIQGHAFGYE